MILDHIFAVDIFWKGHATLRRQMNDWSGNFTDFSLKRSFSLTYRCTRDEARLNTGIDSIDVSLKSLDNETVGIHISS